FPYLMIALSVFFYPPDQIRAIFFKGKEQVKETVKALPNYLTVALSLYFLVQILLPLRHYLFEGDVNFTEEGHRLSWRMMLRLKRGSLQVNVEEKETGTIHKIKLSDYLSRGQSRKVATHPDMLWQFAQRISKEFANQGKEVRVFADAKVSVNGHPRMQLVDPEVDLASVPWEHFRHSDWIFTGYQND
ncbi:MAG: HTTM domain-containing protein, partial [Bacteroidota bacterium]